MKYRRAADVEVAPMKDETILYVPSKQKFCVLNETAAFIWNHLEEPQSIADMSAAVCEAFDGADAAAVERDVEQTLAQFAELQVIIET